MTQHGSFPGRPRGRRARPDNGESDWAGYDATPAEQREFPDLAPIRPREARAQDGRAQADWQAQGQPDWQAQGQAGSYGAGYPGDFGPGGQAPWQEQPWPGQQPVGQPMPQPAAAPQPAAPQGTAPRRARQDKQAEEAPEWAGPDADAVESFSQRWQRRGLDTREDRRADRTKRRRLLVAGGVALVLLVGGITYALVNPGHSAGPGFGQLVTSFLPGELQSVPGACDAVPTASLNQFLPGNSPANTKRAEPPLNGGATSQCTWTLDSAPTYRVLLVNIEAYAPSALYGNGSATFAAISAYDSAQSGMQNPGPKSGRQPATVTDLSGMPGGKNTSAFEATQVFNRGGAITDAVTVLVQYRNVVVTVVINGLDQSNGQKKYGPVSMSDLSSAAKTVAQQVAGKVVG